MATLPGPASARRSEVLAALSIAIDLGLGLPMEHVLRSSLIASVIADELDLADDPRAATYYTNLVLWIGCHADSHEFSHWFGDDLAMRRGSYDLDWAGLPYLLHVLRATGSGRPLPQRARLVLMLALTPRTRMAALIHSHCLSAGLMAGRVGLGEEVQRALACAFERYDGTGMPRGLRGEELSLPTRIVQLAETVEVHLHTYGVSAAMAMARKRRGTQFDPVLVDALLRAEPRLRQLPDHDAWDRALELAPDRGVLLGGEELDDVLRSLGDFADLKTPFTLGHSRAVADLAAGAGERLGLSATDVGRVRRAAYVHDLGRMGVPNSVWEKRGTLSGSDRERIRLYPYLTGRILSRVRGLEVEAALAEAHRERQDGSGYPRGAQAGALSIGQRVLAAADSYRGSLEERPHRPALGSEAAAARLTAEARAGRLDPLAVEAVLAVAGQRKGRRPAGPVGLTAREVEVLGLLSRGATPADIARRLTISPKTVRNHVEHIYAKAGVSNRTGAALFAVQHGLLGDPLTEDGAPAP